MQKNRQKKSSKLAETMRTVVFLSTMLSAILFSLSGCVGQVVGAATDVVIETAKIPVKVGKGVVDVVTPGEDN